MDAREAHFQVPISFPNASGSNISQNLIHATLARSQATTLEHWRDGGGENTDGLTRLAIVGCEDGSLYVLRCSPMPPSRSVEGHVHERVESIKPNISKRNNQFSLNISRPTSPNPSVLSPAFNVTAKPRVVSGITTEQVQAPKNYVDFDDEPDKLKDMLKGKNPRDKSGSDNAPDRTPKSTASSIKEATQSASSKRKPAPPKSLLSPAHSRAPTPPSVSTSSSPGGRQSVSQLPSWKVEYHAIPFRSGFGHSVKTIKFLDEGRLFVTLQESGDIHVYASQDGSCIVSLHIDDDQRDPTATKVERLRPRDVWVWRALTVSQVREATILTALAANGGDLTGESEEVLIETSRCVFYEVVHTTAGSVQLNKIGQWDIEGPALADGLHVDSDGSIIFFSTDHDGHFIIRDFEPFSEQPAVISSEIGREEKHRHHLAIPNAFKAIISRSSEHLPGNEKSSISPVMEVKATLSEPHDLGVVIEDTPLRGFTVRLVDDKLLCIAWNHHSMAMCEYANRSMKSLFHYPADNVENAAWIDDTSYCLHFKDRVEFWRTRLVDSNNDDVQPDSAFLHVQPELIRFVVVGEHDTLIATHDSIILTKAKSQDLGQQILSYPLLAGGSGDSNCHVLWQSTIQDPLNAVSTFLPLELETLIQGYADGRLQQVSLSDIASQSVSEASSSKTSPSTLGSSIIGLHIVQNPRTKEKYIIGGAFDGSIAFWSLNSLELVARWIVFNVPLSSVLQFESTGPLRGCALCVARDGTIAVIGIDGFHLLFIVPGANASLERIALGGNNLLLIYNDQRARLWDTQTKELWRSMGEDKAEELMAKGDWSILNIGRDACVPKTLWARVAPSYDGYDAATTLLLDLERLVVDAVVVTKSISTTKDEIREVLLTLEKLRAILSYLLTPGLSEDMDSICYGKLGIPRSSSTVGFSSPHATTLYHISRPKDVWQISGVVTAARSLAIVAVLRAMSLFEELTDGANTIISFYCTSLAVCVGSDFKQPSLEFLGTLWFEASNELRASIRLIFDETIANLSDDQSIQLTERWQHQVPSLQPDSEKETTNAALALLICGCVASEKYSLLSVNALMDISKSVALYLQDDKSVYRSLAIDLCSRGFHVWQHYIDSMEIMRSLFNLATTARKDAISVQNVGTQARSAVLSIASNNMPLLMGTLCLDILTPPTMEHRRSVLQILAFLIRKRPYVLQASLPRLMEVVVKSLDPNSNSNRELVLDAATEIIGYVVKTYPSVDFHMATQRLAVGTNEGALVMYDLKTAIRLYVLEGHKKSVSAASFSPDGRRLVTVCLEESLVLVWKVGSSFSSFFNPGAPPRQGHGGSEPFKTLNFNIGSEARMTTQETLESVRVEWSAERSVKVKIRQNVLTFST